MGNKIKFMIVDDFATMRKVIRNFLKQIGYEDIVEAEDGVMALKTLKSKEVGFIIADWNMPNMSGIELLREVRRNDELKHIPYLMVTAEALQENVMEAVKSGVNGYIVKPFTADVLKGKIENIIDKK